MPSNRIVYQNWIADLGRDPSQPFDPDNPSQRDLIDHDDLTLTSGLTTDPSTSETHLRRERIREEVRIALGELSDDERELIEQIHFMGRTCHEIAERSGRTEHRLEALHRRALRKLRRRLAPLVRELFGIGVPVKPDCPICQSPNRAQIDCLIRERNPDTTWRPVMREIRNRFGLKITTPQTLIGHEKYH